MCTEQSDVLLDHRDRGRETRRDCMVVVVYSTAPKPLIDPLQGSLSLHLNYPL